jgi:hypothetical protein
LWAFDVLLCPELVLEELLELGGCVGEFEAASAWPMPTPPNRAALMMLAPTITRRIFGATMAITSSPRVR